MTSSLLHNFSHALEIMVLYLCFDIFSSTNTSHKPFFNIPLHSCKNSSNPKKVCLVHVTHMQTHFCSLNFLNFQNFKLMFIQNKKKIMFFVEQRVYMVHSLMTKNKELPISHIRKLLSLKRNVGALVLVWSCAVTSDLSLVSSQDSNPA